MCPVSRPSNEASSPYHSRRKMRKLRDHHVRTPSNLDILELHTREVLKRLEMCPWEEASTCSSLASFYSRFRERLIKISVCGKPGNLVFLANSVILRYLDFIHLLTCLLLNKINKCLSKYYTFFWALKKMPEQANLSSYPHIDFIRI